MPLYKNTKLMYCYFQSEIKEHSYIPPQHNNPSCCCALGEKISTITCFTDIGAKLGLGLSIFFYSQRLLYVTPDLPEVQLLHRKRKNK